MTLNYKEKLSYDLVILSLAQNCEKYLDYFFKNINIASNNLNIKIIIGENGSSDYTFEKIHKSRLDIDFVDTTFVEKYYNRIFRLSKARQMLLEHIRHKNYHSKYICVIDLDDILENCFIYENLKKMITILEKNKNKYFAVSSQSKPYYYDILNFLSDGDFNNSIQELMSSKNFFSFFNRKKKIYDIQKNLSKTTSFECTSSFNGMCIYFFDEFIRSNYFGLDINNKIIPEHINLNLNLSKFTKKKILVTNQAFVNMPNEHRPIFSFTNFMFIKIIKYFSKFIKKFS
jgi:hypothetical protein